MPEGARGFLESIPALRNRECVICGEGVSIPIRVRLDDLEESRRPASADPVFSELWTHVGDEEGILDRTIQRWRRSEEHTSELQSLMRISYAVFCLKKKTSKIIRKRNCDTIIHI